MFSVIITPDDTMQMRFAFLVEFRSRGGKGALNTFGGKLGLKQGQQKTPLQRGFLLFLVKAA
jgi:hypothetical protein